MLAETPTTWHRLPTDASHGLRGHAHNSLPTLTPESRHILTRFFALHQDPLALAADLNQDIIETIEVLADETILAWIAHFQTLITTRRHEFALQTLEQLCKTTQDPIEQRRTATRLLSATRLTKTVPQSAAGSAAAACATPNDAPLLKPNPARNAQQTLHTLLEVIRTKSRSHTQSRATIDAHCAAEANINGSTIQDTFADSETQFENDPSFAPLAIIDRDVEITHEQATQNSSSTFEQPITFTHQQSTTRLTFTLNLTGNLWLITKITLTPNSATTAAPADASSPSSPPGPDPPNPQ